jgi:hypothetical protein
MPAEFRGWKFSAFFADNLLRAFEQLPAGRLR